MSSREGPRSVDGTAIAVENARYPLEPGDLVMPTEGALVRLVHREAYVSPVVDLDAAMANLDWVFDIPSFGLPRPQRPEGQLLIACSDYNVLMNVAYPLHYPSVRRQMAIRLRALEDELEMIFPQTAIEEIAYKGKPASDMIAVLRHTDWGDRDNNCGIFIDARDLASPLSFHIFASRRIHLQELLDAVGFYETDGLTVSVQGYEYVEDDDAIFLFTTGAVAIIWCDVRTDDTDAHGPVEPDYPPPDRPPDRSDADDDGPSDQDEGDAEGGPVLSSFEAEDSRNRSRSSRGSSAPSGERDALLPTLLEVSTLTAEGQHMLKLASHIVDGQLECRRSKVSDACLRKVATPCRTDVKLPPLCHDGPEDGCHTGPVRPCSVKLSKLLPPPCFDCDVQCIRFMQDEEERCARAVLHPWPNFRIAFVCDKIRFHPNTLAALQLCNDTACQELPRHLHIFTDGSEKDGETGWAAVVVQTGGTDSQVAVLGAFGGRVITDRVSPNFVGAVFQDSGSAEVTALIWSLLWLLGHWSLMMVEVATIHFDCTSAGFAVSGRWNAGQDMLKQKARHLAQTLDAHVGPGRVLWRHVKGHSGHPWNEFADSCAACFRTFWDPGISSPILPFEYRIGDLDMSRWHILLGGRDAHAFPKVSSGVANWAAGDNRLTVMQPEQVIPFVEERDATTWCLQVNCMTANLQSAVGKIPFLEQQLEAKRVAIAFFQETKMPGEAIRSARFMRLSSDPDIHWGTAIWISRTVPIGQVGKRPVFIDEQSLNVVASGPRFLILTGTANHELLCLSSVHYPHMGRPFHERLELQRVLDVQWQRFHTGLCIIGCDANGRCPTEYAKVSGDRAFGDFDKAGFHLCETLEGMQWWLPSTFSACHEGPDCTHVHPVGGESRIDYFALSDELQQACVKTWVDFDFDMLNARDDHYALCLDLWQWRARAGHANVRCRKQRFDVDRLKDADVQARVVAKLETIALPSWDLDVNAHAAEFQEHVLRIFGEEIPWRNDRPRSRYLSDATWRLRQQKQNLRSKTANRRRDFRTIVLSLALECWRRASSSAVQYVQKLITKTFLLYEIAATAIQLATGRLKQRIRADKAQHLHELSESLGRRPPQDILAGMRRLQLGRRRLKTWRRQLPGIVRADGLMTKDRVDL